MAQQGYNDPMRANMNYSGYMPQHGGYGSMKSSQPGFQSNQPPHQQPHQQQPNQQQQQSRQSHIQPNLKNEDYRKIALMASQKREVTFDHLNEVKSFKIHNEREYYMTMMMCQKLTEEMTKYKLQTTPKNLLASLDRSPGDNE